MDTTEQVGGDHYKNKKFQPIEFILGNDIPFCEGNVIKYICRWKEKGGLKDLRKARQYIQFLIDKEEEEEHGKTDITGTWK